MTISAICWGASLIIVKPAFEFTTPYRFLFYRYFLASLFSLPYLLYFIFKYRPKIKNFTKITIIELIGTTLALALLYTGLSKTSAVEASLIATTIPIFVVIGGVTLLKEKEEKHEVAGLILAFIGTILLTILPMWKNQTNINSISFWGNILIFLQNIITAYYWILAKKHYYKMPKFFVAAVGYLVGLVSFFWLSLLEIGFTNWSETTNNFIQTVQKDLSHTTVLTSSMYMAIFGSIIGYTAYIKGQENIEASEASLFSYLQPLVYLPLGALWLGEVISTSQILSLLLILLGVIIVEKRSKK